jgi:hypothetical protein
VTYGICPPFLEPRLRLYLSADIVGSTSLKQARARPAGSTDDSTKGPEWFSAIQGFYFEAAQTFLFEWTNKKALSESPDALYGEQPTFWKSVGDEVLFTKVLSDHRQLVTTIKCWQSAVERMRKFLKGENPSLDVKCTAWLAGFPYRNREVVIDRYPRPNGDRVENYYQESGNLLNEFYNGTRKSELSVDYIGPSIDTGFRLTNFSSSRKMVVSIDIAYFVSMTNFDGEIDRIDLHYDGSHSLKGVLGGAPYPVFWINMSGQNSLAVKEDKLKSQSVCNKEDLKEYCDAFYQEYESFTFRPFVKGDVGQTMAKAPIWYADYHAKLVKNFNLPDNEYDIEKVDPEYIPTTIDPEELINLIDDLTITSIEAASSRFLVTDKVSHHKFGKGTVVALEGMKVTVLFQDEIQRRILDPFLEYAK